MVESNLLPPRQRSRLLCWTVVFGLLVLTAVNLQTLQKAHRIDLFAKQQAWLDHTSSKMRAQDDGISSRVNVLYTVFCGRKDRLQLQEPYWTEMIQLGQINEIHLWDFIPRSSPNKMSDDRAYLLQVAEKYSFVTLMTPGKVPMTETLWFDRNNSLAHNVVENTNGTLLLNPPNIRGYSEYYKYYTDHPYDGVIIKADDDIVWINSTQIQPFAQYLWNHTDIFLLSASVVNQGLCAYYQQLHGAIPKHYLDFPKPRNGMGEMIANATQAFLLHKWFLQDPSRFFTPEPEFYDFGYTINVNFVAIRGKDFYVTWELIQHMLHNEQRYYDEGAITWDAIRFRQKRMGIFMPLVVAHATFSHQYIDQPELHDKIIALYTEWGK